VADNLLDNVLETILAWTPQTEYSTETQYCDDLLEFLKKSKLG